MKVRFTSLALAMALLGALLMLPGSVVAQTRPFLRQGIKELGLSGNLDFEQQSRVVLNISGRFGYFPQTNRDCSESTGFIQPVHDGVRREFVDGRRLALHATYPVPDAH